MKWTGSTPLYLYQSIENNQIQNHFSTNYNDTKIGTGTIREF
jgi:hypothetical protein